MTDTQVSIERWVALVPPIFARCVDPQFRTRDFSRPYIVGDFLYATNGRIGVRIPAPAGWDIPNADNVHPGVAKVFESAAGVERVNLGLPAVEGVCSWCDGGGRAAPTRCRCDDCGCEIKREERACEECAGAKVDRPWDRVVVVPGYWIARGFAASLREHGVDTIAVPSDLSSLVASTFRLGQIEGVLMPMSPPDDEERS